MKHIKLFEQLNQTYFEIEYDEYNDLDEGKREEFSSQEIEYLRSISPYTLRYFKNHLSYEISFDYRQVILEISKYTDDWYYVQLLDSSDDDYPNTLEVFYKCDQLDGLKDCINYIEKVIKDRESNQKSFLLPPAHEASKFLQAKYKELDYDTYIQERCDRKRIPFTSIEVDIIKSYNYYFTKSFTISKFGDLITVVLNGFTFYISKSDDEYYYLMTGDDKEDYHFKCDQWDGLISCLEREVISKIKKMYNIKESISKKIGFEKISNEKFLKKAFNNNVGRYQNHDRFLEIEIDSLSKFDFHLNHTVLVRSMIVDGITHNPIISLQLNNRSSGIMYSIYKLKDEWYYVNKIDYSLGGDSIDSFYECDQWDGLINFLNMEIENEKYPKYA